MSSCHNWKRPAEARYCVKEAPPIHVMSCIADSVTMNQFYALYADLDIMADRVVAARFSAVINNNCYQMSHFGKLIGILSSASEPA